MAAYGKTPNTASLHNVDGLQMHKPQHTHVIDNSMDSRNNMTPPSRPGSPSPSSAHSVSVSPSFSLSRTVEFDLTKHKKESEQISIDLTSNNKKHESFSYKREKDQVNNQINSTKIRTIEEKAISVIAPNPHKVINSEIRCDVPDSISNQNVKSVNTEDYENKFSKQDNKIAWDVVDTPIITEVEGTTNVEQMLEATFLTNESEKQSVIDIVKPIKSLSPTIKRAESIDKILKSPSLIPRIEHDKPEDFIPSENSSKQQHDTHTQLPEEENKLEELLGGVITSTSTSDQQTMTENNSKPVISTKKPRNKNKKQIIKVKITSPVAEKLKKQKHDKHTQLPEEENKSEELLGGVTTSTSTSDQQTMTENKSKPVIPTKKPRNKNKKQLKKIKITLPVAEKLKKQKHDKHTQLPEEENKSEELLGGVTTSTSTSDQQTMTENKSKPVIPTKKPRNKNKKQLKKVKKILPVAEKLKKQKHDTHTQLPEEENKLEELLGGVITSTSTSDQQTMTENKSKPVISTKKPCNKNKKQLKKVKKILPVAEKLNTVVEPPTKKYKGPFVRINGGNIENPTNFVIINRSVQNDKDSSDGQNINRKTFTNKSRGYNGEEKPDVNNLESSDWKCVYCSQGPNVTNVQDPSGDLFGPYYVSKPKVVKSNYNPKRKKTMDNFNDNNTSETCIEVWTHENCLVWASGVYMVGDKIIGLEDSVRDATNTICSYCGVNGASIGCIARHCEMCAHYNCAIRVGWFLNSQNHMTTCNKHKNSPLGRSCH